MGVPKSSIEQAAKLQKRRNAAKRAGSVKRDNRKISPRATGSKFVVRTVQGRTAAEDAPFIPADQEQAQEHLPSVYNASAPSVLFYKLRHGLLRRWHVDGFARRLKSWLTLSGKSAPNDVSRPPAARDDAYPQKRSRSGLILTSADDPFLLTQPSDAMTDLLAENMRLRQIVDDLVRDEPELYRHLTRQ